MILEDIRKGISSVKRALADKSDVAHYTHLLMKDGEILATNSNLSAGAPILYEDTMLVPGAEFEAIINRLPGNPSIEHSDGRVTFKAGRFKGSVPTLPPEHATVMGRHGENRRPLPAGFIDRLRAVREFVSDEDNPAWMASVIFSDGNMVAVGRGGTSMAATDCGDADLGNSGILLPRSAVDFVLKRGTDPQFIEWNQSAAAFTWDDGSWLRTNLLVGSPPKKLSERMATVVQPEWEITDEFRAAYERVASISESEVRIYADRITGGGPHCDVEDGATAPVPQGMEYSVWNPKTLGPVLAAASHWDPSNYPNPTVFWGSKVRGLLMGRVT